jgi:hypothetical protein
MEEPMNQRLLLALLLPSLALAYSGGPPNGLSGAPGEGTCIQCHSGNGLNSGDGFFNIDGPMQFQAGETYTITVTLQDPGQQRWGFELSPLEHGSLAAGDGLTQVSSSGGRSYAKQTGSGTFNGTADGPVSWSFDWTAPLDPPETVVFYAAGNAADGTGGTSGDFIYTTSFSSELETSVAASPRPMGFTLLGNQPNPFNPDTEIVFALEQPQSARLEVYDLRGVRVALLHDGPLAAGEHRARFSAGTNLASGLYIAQLSAGGWQQAQPMLLIK